ncbi:Core-2/I-branching beta-1 6-N-acetylglucosaminyltransferase family protein [Euphorbia peplus]|nr:Core-2/I-branching beta-1 6-N-acetylglucosaminyltransferase family protein [Euphorbia peplus]
MLACSYFKTFPSFINFDANVYSLSFSVPSPLKFPSEPLPRESPPHPPPSPVPSSPAPPPPSLQAPPRRPLEILSPLMHNMSDEELFERAIRVSKNSLEDEENKMIKKVAFMFLTYGWLPMDPLWQKYFEGHEGLYSIYVHPHPSYNDTWPPNSVFFGRRIPSQEVSWGTDSMMAAEKRLLANALLDISNERFILLSESCIPLINFKTTYDYLMNTNLSFVESYDNPKKAGRGRYNPQMSPYINITHWRKGSQWFEATRDLAINIISDRKYYKLFQEYCLPPCYFDEHYIPTLLNVLYPEVSSNRTITYVDWSRGGPHPAKFGRSDWITEEFLNGIRNGTECVYNGKSTTMCYMFARKFTRNTLKPLLRMLPTD